MNEVFFQETTKRFSLDSGSLVRSIHRCMSSLPNYETLKLTQPQSHVTLVELNRPDKHNAMNKQLFEYVVRIFLVLIIQRKKLILKNQ